MTTGVQDGQLEAELSRALASPALARSRIARDTLLALHELTKAGHTATQYELAERLYSDVNDVDRVRAAVKTLRQRLAAHYAGEGADAPLRLDFPLGEYRLVLVPRPEPVVDVAPAPPGEVAPGPRRAAPPSGMPLRRFLFAVLVITSVGGVLGHATAPWGEPATVEFVGASAIARDGDGRLVWAYDFREPVQPQLEGAGWLLIDLENDGHVEALLAPAPMSDHPHDLVLCINDRGQEIWHLQLSKNATACAPALPFYNARHLGSFRATPDGPVYIALTAGHESLGTCLVLVIDAEGQVVARYCHPGHLPFQANWDADGDGDLEIVLAQCNNDLGEAALLVLEDEDFDLPSSTTPSADPLLAPPCRWYVRMPFPRPLASSVRPHVTDLGVVDGVLEVTEGADGASFLHRFKTIRSVTTHATLELPKWVEQRKELVGDVTDVASLVAASHAGMSFKERGEWEHPR